jgi:hypothetical protein
MPSVRRAPVPSLTREEQIAALMNQLRPKVEETLRRLVERGNEKGTQLNGTCAVSTARKCSSSCTKGRRKGDAAIF